MSQSDQKDSNTISEQLPFENLKGVRADDDISLSEIFEIIWKGKYKIILFIVGFFLLGIFHYTTAPEEYKSYTKLLREAEGQQGPSDGLRLLGQFGGFNFGGSAGATRGISPEIYPEIIESVNFQQILLFQPITFSKYERELTLFEYFNEYYKPPVRTRVYKGVIDYTIKLPFTLYRHLRNLFRQNPNSDIIIDNVTADREVLILSPQFRFAMSQIKDRIHLDYDGLILEVETTLTDPMAASQINTIVADRIREYIINYRSEKARQNLQFVENLHREAKERYEISQFALADFTDRNRGNLTATAQIEQERLQDEKELTFQIYSSISQRLEEAKVRLQEDTPIFTTIQQPILPAQPEQSSILVIPAFIILGTILGLVWLFGEKGYVYIREKISEFDS